MIDVLRADENDELSPLVESLNGLSHAQWNQLLHRLQDLRLLSVADDGALDTHPLLRSYFAQR